MPKGNNRTVSPRGDLWAVVRDGAKRASSVHDSQKAAIDAARQAIKREGGGELRIKGVDNLFRAADTVPPKKDPFPPRG